MKKMRFEFVVLGTKKFFSTAQERILNAGKNTNPSSAKGAFESISTTSPSKNHGAMNMIKKNLLWSFPIVTFGLGCWQVKRLEWKLGLIQEIKDSIHVYQKSFRTGSELLSSIAELRPLKEYNRVKLRGKFLDGNEMYLGPRSKSDIATHTGGGVFSSGSSTGYHVITPFVIENDQNENEGIILVNRGWIPREFQQQKLKTSHLQNKSTSTSSIVELDGIIRKGEQKGNFMPDNQPQDNNWFYLNVNEMANHVKAEPILIEQVTDKFDDSLFAEKGLPIPRRTDAELRIRNNHLEYAITWFGLSLASAILLKTKRR